MVKVKFLKFNDGGEERALIGVKVLGCEFLIVLWCWGRLWMIRLI